MWLTLVCSNRQATTVCIHCWVRIDFKQVHPESRILAVVTSILSPLSLFLAVGQVLFRPLFQVANSLRVIKTKKQTSSENCSYLSAAQQIIEKDTLVVYLFGKNSTSYKYPTLQLIYIYAILIMWETKSHKPFLILPEMGRRGSVQTSAHQAAVACLGISFISDGWVGKDR
jgi:hypothetical protein